ncbi:MAG: hypothetical protein PHC95_12785 [Parabacteroides sp.]|nr:hypothetical protein [Parabacteroides sp.]
MKDKVRNIEDQNVIDYLEKAPKWIADNKAFTDWLTEKGFFRTSASTVHHGAYAGALYKHSDAVREVLEEYTELGLIDWDRPVSPFIIGMYHDLCKIDTYREEYDHYIEADDGTRFPKGDPHFVWDDAGVIIPGHAEKSLIYILQWIPLTSQEIACIRWHMGAFEKDPKMWEYYGRAIEQDSAVLYTHTADMVASRVKGI